MGWVVVSGFRVIVMCSVVEFRSFCWVLPLKVSENVSNTQGIIEGRDVGDFVPRLGVQFSRVPRRWRVFRSVCVRRDIKIECDLLLSARDKLTASMHAEPGMLLYSLPSFIISRTAVDPGN